MDIEKHEQLIRQTLAENGHAESADEVLASYEPAIFLSPNEEPAEVGGEQAWRSRNPFIGPNGFSWPSFEGEPMTCAAQIDLSCLAATDLWPGPKSGILAIFDAFFLTEEHGAKYIGSGDAHLARACHFTDGEYLVEQVYPYSQDLAGDIARTPEIGLLQQFETGLVRRLRPDRRLLPREREIEVICEQIPDWLPKELQLLGPADDDVSKYDPARNVASYHRGGELGQLWDDANPSDWVNFFRPGLDGVGVGSFTILLPDLRTGRFDRI